MGGRQCAQSLHSTSNSSSTHPLVEILRRVAGSGDRDFVICRLGGFWSDVGGCGRVIGVGGGGR